MQVTIGIAIKLIFENNPQLKITKHELKQLFNFATSGTSFTFNGSFYDQIDEFVHGLSQKKWLQQCDKEKVLMCKRNIDGIFGVL